MNTVLEMPYLETRAYPPELERKNTIVATMEELMSSAKSERRSLTTKEQSEWDLLKKEAEDIDKILKKAETREFKTRIATPQQEEEVRNFVHYIATGEMRDLSSTGSNVIVPKTISDQVISKVKEISPLYNQLSHFNVQGDLSLPVYDYSVHLTQKIVEFEEINLQMGSFLTVNLKGTTIGTLTKIGRSLLAKTNLDVVSVIVQQLALSISDFISDELINNTNTAFSGTLQAVTQSVTGEAGAISADNLIDLQMSVPSRFQNESAFLMHPTTFSAVRKLKDNNDSYLMVSNSESLRSNIPYTLLGSPVMIDENMPLYGVGARAVYYGSFASIACNTNQDLQVQILLEALATQHATGIILTQTLDCNLADTRGLSVLVGA
jgi:HK97 family phage major capsid protein